MRLFIKLAVLILVGHGLVQAEGREKCDTSGLEASSLYGWGFLQLFPYESVPYDDYTVGIEYHDHYRKAGSTVVIGFAEEGDQVCHVFKKEVLAKDGEISFFNLIDADTDKEVGFGSCRHVGGIKQSCEYLYRKDKTPSSSWHNIRGQVKVYVDLANRKFEAYSFKPNDGASFKIGVRLEE